MDRKFYKPSVKNLVMRKESEDLYILINHYGKILKINSVGKNIIDLCDGENSLEEIVNKICDQYDIEKQVAYNDISDFIDKLDICGLLKNIR